MSEQVGTIRWINGPVIRASGSRRVNMLDLVEVGEERLDDATHHVELSGRVEVRRGRASSGTSEGAKATDEMLQRRGSETHSRE